MTRGASSVGSIFSVTIGTSRTWCRSTIARRAEPDLRGELELLDIESGGVRKVTVTERSLRQYRQVSESFLGQVSAMAVPMAWVARKPRPRFRSTS